MKYIELKVHTTRQGIEPLTELFMENGITNLSVDDPEDLTDIMNKENGYEWDYIDESLTAEAQRRREAKVSAYFEDTEEGRKQISSLKVAIMMLKASEQYGDYGKGVDFGRLYAESNVVDDEEWKDNWKQYFKPARVTDRIVIKPSWEEYEAQDDELILEIDPGMAFGTGTHETTSLCMKLMEKFLAKPAEQEGEPSHDVKVLDVGCGSGVLAIAAGLLGADDVLGIEIDPEAVPIAQENIELNGLADKVKVQEGDLTKGVDYKADIVVANLMADLVMKLAPDAAKHVKEGGIFISSGILTEKKNLVAEAIKKAGFEIEEIAEDGEWCAIAARPKKKGLFARLFG